MIAELPNTVHSCSRHGVAAARLTSERPGSIIPMPKNIYFVGTTFIASITVDVFETDRERLAVRAQYFSSYRPASYLPRYTFYFQVQVIPRLTSSTHSAITDRKADNRTTKIMFLPKVTRDNKFEMIPQVKISSQNIQNSN